MESETGTASNEVATQTSDETQEKQTYTVSSTVGEALAALLYYQQTPTKDEKGKKTGRKSFEKLSKKEREVFYERAQIFLDGIEKLNLMLTKKVTKEEAAAKEKAYHEELCTIIKNHFKQIKVFKKELFPVEELAHRILQGRKE